MKEIIWTETALQTFFKVVDYLFEYWTANEIESCEFEVDNLIERIASFKEICPQSKLFGIKNVLLMNTIHLFTIA